MNSAKTHHTTLVQHTCAPDRLAVVTVSVGQSTPSVTIGSDEAYGPARAQEGVATDCGTQAATWMECEACRLLAAREARDLETKTARRRERGVNVDGTADGSNTQGPGSSSGSCNPRWKPVLHLHNAPAPRNEPQRWLRVYQTMPPREEIERALLPLSLGGTPAGVGSLPGHVADNVVPGSYLRRRPGDGVGQSAFGDDKCCESWEAGDGAVRCNGEDPAARLGRYIARKEG